MKFVDWRTYLRCPFAPTEPEDQIDPERYPGGAAADAAFMINDAIRGNRIQPTASAAATALDLHRRMVKPLGSESPAPADAVPTPIIDDEATTRKIITSEPLTDEEEARLWDVTLMDGLDDEATTRPTGCGILIARGDFLAYCNGKHLCGFCSAIKKEN